MTTQASIATLEPHPTGVAVLRVAGELDFHTSPQVWKVLDTVDFGLSTGLVIDGAGLTYCDSTGISVFVVAYQRAQVAGGSFGLAGLNRELMRLFRVIGLENVLPFHPTIEEAVDCPRP